MYSAQITRTNPTCIVLLIDQSGSMSDAFAGGDAGRSKADELATIINRLLASLVIRCSISMRCVSVRRPACCCSTAGAAVSMVIIPP